MDNIYCSTMKRITALLLAAGVLFASGSFQSFATGTQENPTADLGTSTHAPSENEEPEPSATKDSLVTPLGLSGLKTVNEILLPPDTEITFYEEYEGIPYVYRYGNWNTETITGNYTPDTVLLMGEDAFNNMYIEGQVKLGRIHSKGFLTLDYIGSGSLTLENSSGQTPLEAARFLITGNSEEENTLSVIGASGAKVYDLDVDYLQISHIKNFSVEPNTVRISEDLNAYESSLSFKVGAALPDSVKDGAYTYKLNLHSGASLVVDSTNLPDNALHVENDLTMYPGHLTVSGGNKAAVRVSGSQMMAQVSSTLHVTATAPDSIGILYDPDPNTTVGVSFGSSKVFAQGDAYGLKMTAGALSISGSHDPEVSVGESTFKGGLSAISVKATPYSSFYLSHHQLNLILTGSHPNALGALYFDPNNTSSQVLIQGDAVLNAVAETQPFQGAAVHIVDSFTPETWATSPIQFSENGQITTTMPSHKESPLWAIKSPAIHMGDEGESSISLTYTDAVSFGRTPTYPYQSAYDPTLFTWATQPVAVDFETDSDGFTAKETAERTTLTGTAITLPPTITAQENNPYRVTYALVDFSNSGTVTLDPMAGEVSEPTLPVVFGQPIGTLPEAVNPRKLFMGWFTEKDGQGLQITPDYIVTESRTFYAHWTTPLHRITYQPTLPELDSTEETAAMGTLLAPPPLTLAGFTLDGWYKDAAFTSPWNFSTDFVPNNAVVLYAKWSKSSYTVTFDTGSTTSSTLVSFGSLIPSPDTPVQAGKIFVGWAQDGPATRTGLWNFETHTMPAQDLTLVAQWRGTEPNPEPEKPNPELGSGNSSSSSGLSPKGREITDKGTPPKKAPKAPLYPKPAPPEQTPPLSPAPSSRDAEGTTHPSTNPQTGGHPSSWGKKPSADEALYSKSQPSDQATDTNKPLVSKVEPEVATNHELESPTKSSLICIPLACLLLGLFLLLALILLLILWVCSRKNKQG